MRYKELNLKEIREECDLDFAHYTYEKGMCSCCFGPKDLAKRYWKNNKVSSKYPFEVWKEGFEFGNKLDKPHENGYEYLLFKNADNGSGSVTSEDTIENVCIQWGFPSEKLDKVCSMLQEQLGDDYKVIKPTAFSRCIEIIEK